MTTNSSLLVADPPGFLPRRRLTFSSVMLLVGDVRDSCRLRLVEFRRLVQLPLEGYSALADQLDFPFRSVGAARITIVSDARLDPLVVAGWKPWPTSA